MGGSFLFFSQFLGLNFFSFIDSLYIHTSNRRIYLLVRIDAVIMDHWTLRVRGCETVALPVVAFTVSV